MGCTRAPSTSMLAAIWSPSPPRVLPRRCVPLHLPRTFIWPSRRPLRHLWLLLLSKAPLRSARLERRLLGAGHRPMESVLRSCGCRSRLQTRPELQCSHPQDRRGAQHSSFFGCRLGARRQRRHSLRLHRCRTGSFPKVHLRPAPLLRSCSCGRVRRLRCLQVHRRRGAGRAPLRSARAR